MLSLQASPHQATKHTVRYKHHLLVTPLRIWKLSDAYFAKKSTKAVDINLTTIKHNLTKSILFKKNSFYLSVKVFSTKVLIEDTILTSPTGDRTAMLRGHHSHAKVYRLQCKESTFISQLF